jgi:probable phosphoglycerate mutase
VVAVSHGGAIGMALSIATGSRPFAFVAVDNGAISTIVVSDERWFLRSFNDVCHLT